MQIGEIVRSYDEIKLLNWYPRADKSYKSNDLNTIFEASNKLSFLDEKAIAEVDGNCPDV